MTRYTKRNGKYKISGSNFSSLVGSRAQVWHGSCYKTSGGLTKSDLMKNKSGRIVSKSKNSSAKKENRLVKHGFGTKKGIFGFFQMGSKSTKSKKSKKMRGGHSSNNYSPANIDGQGLTQYPNAGSTNVQLMAGQAGGKGYGWLSGNGIDGQGLTQYTNAGSTNLQLQAGMAGGRRRRKKRGGTTKPIPYPLSNPQTAVLNRAS